MKILLVGDYDNKIVAHQAIPQAIELSARLLTVKVEQVWARTRDLDPAVMPDCDACWCVPFSPYENPEAVIAAIRFARENDIPFLGTCAGFQHAVIEYSRNALGLNSAASIEDNPAATIPVITALGCRLYDESEAINIERESRAGEIYQADRIMEEYHCGFGVNPELMHIFDDSELKFSGHDDNGEPRLCEIPGHRFFIGTAFQPERSALEPRVHPLITAFLRAAI